MAAHDFSLHLPAYDPYGEAVRRRLYIGAVSFGVLLLGGSVALQWWLNLREPYLLYIAPLLLILGLADLWWLLTKRSLAVAEIVGIGVLAAATVVHVALVSLGPQPQGAYPNSGPYWTVVCVCTLAFLALPPRRAATFNLAFVVLAVAVPWVLPGSQVSHFAAGLVRLQLNAVIVVLLIWGLAWFRAQHASQAETQELLRQMAFTDALTRLPNRRAVYPAVDALLSDAARGQSGSLFLVDLDHFKRINDQYGHSVGDEVLVAAGQVLRNCAAEVGANPPTVGRWGGEEFIVVMPGTTPESARVRAEQLLAEFRAWSWPHGLRVTVSIGSSSVRSGEEFSALLARADEAMYAAKSAGRDRAVASGSAALVFPH
ncbi:hypothetical protein GCM10022631_12230 [Deinococcus rubellus]|uniref:GGDEF domain-containing protein n=1 Tax=Deinococcus rubellus TaxID=1889240 RepID=A0ABY5YDD7_9DEIO|nr:GGDEF domain-containing protein [Deinococcus rubellus]UWX62731.1 GGDEF domain-containing protein [Deinococcus rubellus]